MPFELPIPDHAKWQIAAKLASEMPGLYDIAFSEAVGDRYDTLEQQVWVYLGHEARSIADSFRLPVRNAEELADTLRVLRTVMFGPDTRAELVKIVPERSVLMMRECPVLNREMERGSFSSHQFNRCMAFSIAAIEALNPAYTLRFVRSMCMGDRTCEMKIAKKEELERGEKKEKGK